MNLFVDVMPEGSLKMNWIDRDFDEIPETCALDVADRGGGSLDHVGFYMHLTKARVQQLEEKIMKILRRTDRKEHGALRELLRDMAEMDRQSEDSEMVDSRCSSLRGDFRGENGPHELIDAEEIC